MSRLFVHYEDHASAEMHKTSKITLPKKWLSGPCTALLELFVKTYNGKVRGWLSPPVKMMPFTRNLILSAACSLRNQPVSRKPVGHQLHAPRKREGYVTGQLMRCVFFWNCRQSTPHALALSAGEALANECVVSEFVGPSADVYVKHGPPPMLSAVTAARLGDSAAAAAAAAVPPPVRTGVDASPRAAGPPAAGDLLQVTSLLCATAATRNFLLTSNHRPPVRCCSLSDNNELALSSANDSAVRRNSILR
jgi:hypothetical protein